MPGGGGGGGGGGIPPPLLETTLIFSGFEETFEAFFLFSFSKLLITLFISILFVLPEHNSTIGLEGSFGAVSEEEEILDPPPDGPAIFACKAAILAAKFPPPIFAGGFEPDVLGAVLVFVFGAVVFVLGAIVLVLIVFFGAVFVFVLGAVFIVFLGAVFIVFFGAVFVVVFGAGSKLDFTLVFVFVFGAVFVFVFGVVVELVLGGKLGLFDAVCGFSPGF